jgi:hypothetical protein
VTARGASREEEGAADRDGWLAGMRRSFDDGWD